MARHLDCAPEAIAQDDALSHQRLPARYAAHGVPDEGPQLRASLDQRGLTPEQAILDLLGGTDVIGAARAAGVGDRQLETLRSRLLG